MRRHIVVLRLRNGDVEHHELAAEPGNVLRVRCWDGLEREFSFARWLSGCRESGIGVYVEAP